MFTLNQGEFAPRSKLLSNGAPMGRLFLHLERRRHCATQVGFIHRKNGTLAGSASLPMSRAVPAGPLLSLRFIHSAESAIGAR